ncbi:MAG: hypothetical protein QW514_08585 [Thermoprotei archaeon]
MAVPRKFRGYCLRLGGPTVSVGYVVGVVAGALGLRGGDASMREVGVGVHRLVEGVFSGGLRSAHNGGFGDGGVVSRVDVKRVVGLAKRVYGELGLKPSTFEETFESGGLRLRGTPDIVLSDGSPIEVKSCAPPAKTHLTHRIQVCLYALLLEDVLGWDVDVGYVYYALGGALRRVDVDMGLRAYTLGVLRRARRKKLMSTGVFEGYA